MTLATNNLIDSLVDDLQSIDRRTLSQRFLLGLLPGIVLAFFVMVVWLGFRSDLDAATETAPFWIKFGYTLLLGTAGILALERLGRPDCPPRKGGWLAVAALLAVLTLAAAEMSYAAPSARTVLLFGGTSTFCPFAIVALATPIGIGAFWTLRGLAPTRLTLTGAAAGLTAGAIAAFIYSFSCGEVAIAFLATWYTSGILGSGLIGALLGRRLLRW